MNERVALVTGGAKGIGRAVALDLAGRGWSIAVAYRTSEKDASDVVAGVRGLGRAASAHRADVSDPAQVEALARAVTAGLGRIDALVHCAGPYHRVDLLNETPEGWRSMFENNLHSLFYCVRAIAPQMMQRKWGRVVAFGMANADRLTAQPQLTAHYLSKVGVVGLVRTLAKILAPHGVTANAISPGFIDSGGVEPAELEKLLKTIPAGRIGSLDDATAVVAFLLSDGAAYVNGGNIHLSGGWGL